ncbi:MAG TPA: class I SAM-dependent methyltransferase [Acidimicrobiales bacterium]|nr:class I SAM-dependent methyltransferase [Acidimicrobiales bacterium]
MADDLGAMRAYYAQDKERDRLAFGLGRVELARTIEVVGRTLPPPPAVVADLGGGPGRYTDWLVEAGYDVVHRDVVEHHVAQVRARHGERVDSAVGDARALDLPDASVDVVLLLGPLYHLVQAGDRGRALQEAARILRPGGILHAAAISRWATRMDGILTNRFHLLFPGMVDAVDEAERTGHLPPIVEAGFTGYTHRPDELRDEVTAAGFEVQSLVSLEGVAFALADLDERWDDDTERTLLLDTLRALESVPELLGVGPHLLATGRRI